jgi:predicted amidophosphoribosyltransferase
VRRLIVVHKEHGRLAAAVPLGRLLAAAVEAGDTGDGPLLLVPVPSRPGVVRARGHDPVARMARAATRWLPPATVAAALQHTRRVADQSGLGREQRWSNLAGALQVRDAGRPAAAQVVVVDDVCSSGATVAAAAAALAVWGLPVRAAVVAAPPRRDGWR